MGSNLFKLSIILLIGVLTGTPAFAKKERYQNALEGAKGGIAKDSSMAVSDSNNTYPASSWNSYVVLRINELYGKPGNVAMPDSFTAKIKFTIAYKTANSNNLLYKDTSLVLSYNRFKPSNSRVIQLLGSNSYFQITINEVIVEQAASSNVLPYLILESYLDVERIYNLSCTDNLIFNLLHTTDPLVNEMDELSVRWDKVVPADEYDLEWAWIDQKALEQGNYGPLSNPTLNLIFGNNASRATLYKELYKIPLLYDDNGFLFYRVRPVQYAEDGERKTGLWSVPNINGNSSEKFAFAGHERKLNWQASTTFAEDGKRKSVVEYFDGNLKNRQTVTKDNTTGTTIVSETLYDRQGRPAIQVLPAPTLNSLIKYTPKFNLDINGAEYDKDAYDRLITPAEYCGVAAKPMGTQIGASKYYSTSNTDYSLSNSKFIPIGSGFPFSETRYMADNTGRIAAQSGVGPLYALGTGKETKYYYSVPSQEQMDALFGTEAGLANYYQKTMVKDANGQYSVSYSDLSGKTIATALAGTPPASLLQLSNYKEQTITENLLSKQNTYVEGTSIINSSSILVAKPVVHYFNYTLTPQVLQGTSLVTPAIPVCYDCLYDVVITVTNDCNNKGLPGDTAFRITRTNVQIGLPDTICGNNSAVNINETFNIFLPEGAYNITKKLSVSDSSMQKYREVYMRHNTIKTKESFIEEWTNTIQAGTPCKLTCDSCITLSQTGRTAYVQNYVNSLNLPAGTNDNDYRSEAGATYDRLSQECGLICEGYSDYTNYREVMLADMTPPSGQYARPSNYLNDPSYNVDDPSTYPQFYGIFTYGNPLLYKLGTYVDANNQLQKIMYNGVLTAPEALPEAAFIENFEPQWAKTLLQFHPEYNRLLKFESYKPTHIWNEKFEKVENYTEAKNSGYLTPLGSLTGYTALQGSVIDPFFLTQPLPYLGEPGLLNTFKNKLIAYKTINVPWQTQAVTLNLWQFVNLNVSCIRNNSEVTQQCFEAAINPNNVFSATFFCENDLQMAWKMFRDLYIQIKKSYVNEQVLTVNTVPTSVITNPAVSRFIRLSDVESQFNITGGITATDFNALSTQSMEQQATSTCSSYVELWWQQLAPCEISEAEKASIINQMVEVCKRGFDSEHPTGASSVNKVKYPTYAPESFINIIKTWAINNNKDLSKCNGYLIDAPKPYNVPSTVGDKPITEKPDSCSCNKITGLKTEATSKGFGNNLSGYLKQYYQTDIRQGTLDTLIGMCNGTLGNCRFLPAVINLPPVLQCLSAPVCISCDEAKALKDTFTLKYPGTLSFSTDNLVQNQYNKLFEKYMNYYTGFGYSHVEYMQFLNNCTNISLSTNTQCNDLQNTLSAFKNQYYKAPIHLYNAVTGCDTARWVSNTGQGKLQVTPLSEEIINSEFVTKAITSEKFSSVDYYDTVCLGNKLTFETRVKMPRTGNAFNEYAADPYNTYSFSNFFYFNAPSDVKGYEGVDFPVDNFSGYSQLHSAHGSYGTQGPIILPTNFDSFRVIKVEVTPDTFRYYIDNVFISAFPHQNYTHFYGYYFAPYAASMRIDWTKITDEFGQVILFEDFNSCTNLAQINKEPCKPACQPAFATYFNQTRSTNYTYQQIDSIYNSQCGISPNACNTVTTGSLKLCVQSTSAQQQPEIVEEDACADVTQLGIEKGTLAYQLYRDSINNDFDRLYLQKCMAAVDFEKFTVQHPVAEYHYTLYYYDRAGNLVKTVPPESVTPNYDQAWLDAVKLARTNNQPKTISHKLATNYRYNSLNQVIAQITPDAGLSKFWYDRIGRLVLSQNAKQLESKKYSYTLYDKLGRITEVGQKQNLVTVVNQTLTRDNLQLNNFINYNNAQYAQTEVTNTVYDKAPIYNTSGMPQGFAQQTYTLRNRVSYTRYFDTHVYATDGSVDPLQYNTATYYNYDIHGNVKQLLNDYSGSMLGTLQSNKFKLIEYKYDLISGKVNQVSYQPGKADQFYHRYQYDAENRITDVYTSTNPLFVGNTLLEDHDAFYQYYKHGPLARLLLGTQQVQGVDYAYTLQGWLKGVNSTAVKPQWDMGLDGYTGSNIARDAYGFALYYSVSEYDELTDYTPISSPNTVARPFGYWAYAIGVKPLYNGNIAAASVHIPSVGSPLLYTYRYDQLNRLKTMRVKRNDASMLDANNWGYNPPAINDFNEDIYYDANGNILSYIRNGNTIAGKPLGMDNLTYNYVPGTNRLDHIKDAIPKTNYNEDIDNQYPGNYVYDAIGNLIKDNAEGITNIEWTVYGKIKKITKKDGTVITYQYAPDGNRLSKDVTKGTETTITAYVRDAQGNVMGVYQKKNNTLILQEQHIYGSSRLGIYKPLTDVTTLAGDVVYPRLRGNTAYELTNHLGNVLVTVRDIKKANATNNIVNYYEADVITANDYYPFGMPIPGRNKYETETTETKQVQDCLSCSALQSLINGYFTSINYNYELGSGNETDMVNYIQAQLSGDNMSFTIQEIKDALTACNNSWKKNISLRTQRLAIFGGTRLIFHKENFSVEAWAHPVAQDNKVHTIVNSISELFGTYSGYHLYEQEGQVYFWVGDGYMQLINGQQGIPAQGGSARIRTVNKIDYNKWHQIVAVRVGNSATDFKIYVDGVLQQTEVADYAYMSNGDVYSEYQNGQVLVAGGTGGSYTWGNIKNVRVYKREVTTAEAMSNYNDCTGVPSNTTNLLLWGKFDEGSGAVAVDHSSYHVDGAMYSSLWHGGVGDAVAPACVTVNESVLCKTRTVTSAIVQGYRYGFNGKENDNDVKGEGNQQDYGMRIYDPRLGRFLSTDPLTRSFSMLTPYQYASNSPIDGIDLDGLEYLSFHKSMYRMEYQIMTNEIAAKDGTKHSVTTANTVVNTVYENIPPELQDAKFKSFKYIGTGAVTVNGRDYDPNLDGPAYLPAGKYYQKGPKFFGLGNGGQDPEPTNSSKGMGGGAIKQGRANAASGVGGALGEDGAGVVSNWFHAIFDDVQGAINKENDSKKGFYKATKVVDYYLNNNMINGNTFGASDRSMLINFLTDGYLPSDATDKYTGANYRALRKDGYDKQLLVAYHGLQMMNQQGIQIGQKTKISVESILKKYKASGGGNKYDSIKTLLK